VRHDRRSDRLRAARRARAPAIGAIGGLFALHVLYVTVWAERIVLLLDALGMGALVAGQIVVHADCPSCAWPLLAAQLSLGGVVGGLLLLGPTRKMTACCTAAPRATVGRATRATWSQPSWLAV
jgi:hypothetical protein